MRNSDKITLGIKYIAMALLIGIIVGIVDTIFGRGLLAISDFRTANYKYLIPFLPIAGLFIVWMYSYFSKVSLKGMTLVFEAGQNKRDSIPMALVPLVMIGTWITHLFGGSAGREGVAVQIGATLSHYMGRKLKTPDNSRIMLITGMAAGFGGLFQTPLAATFFAMEVIVAGYMDYQALLPAITAAFVASFTSHSLGLEKFAVELNETINMSDAKTVIIIIILGLAFGIVGRIFSYLLQLLKKIMAEKIVNPYLRIGLVSIPLAIILLLLWQGRYSGLGTNLILNAILITFYGSVGAAISTVCAEFIILFVQLFFLRKDITLLSVISSGWKYFAAGIVMFIPCYIVGIKLESSILNTLIIVAIGIFVYGIMLLILKDEFIYSILGKLKRKK